MARELPEHLDSNTYTGCIWWAEHSEQSAQEWIERSKTPSWMRGMGTTKETCLDMAELAQRHSREYREKAEWLVGE